MRGDTFLTRRVKTAGTYWLAWTPRTRTRPHRRAIGVLAPKTIIDEARTAAAATQDQRAKQRVEGAKYRDRQEDRYRGELEAAVIAYLEFAPQHAPLAAGIAQRAASRAGEVGSGRVGRTRQISLEERAALAARADIRHNHTTYDNALAELDEDLGVAEPLYREIKSSAQEAVDEFLTKHREP